MAALLNNKPNKLVIRPFDDGELWKIVGIDKSKGLEVTYLTGMSLFQAKKAVQNLADECNIIWQIDDVKSSDYYY